VEAGTEDARREHDEARIEARGGGRRVGRPTEEEEQCARAARARGSTSMALITAAQDKACEISMHNRIW